MHGKEVPVDLGVIESDASGRLVAYREKPVYRFEVSMGVYVYEPHVLRYIPRGKPMDFPDLVHTLLEKGEMVSGFRSEDYWLDIGRREDYELAQLEYASRREDFQVA